MKIYYYLFFSVFLLQGCIKNNPDPAWLEVNKWTLETNPNSENATGELTDNFTEAWVYIDNKIVGVFEVPFKIPILQSGNVAITIYPAIKNNGIRNAKKIYPFVEPYQLTANLVKNETLTINPTTRYIESTKFWIEDFEDAAIKIVTDPNSKDTLIAGNNPDILKYGNFYGEINLNAEQNTYVGFTEQLSNIPRGKEVYLEIDYYNTNALTTGVLAITSSSIQNNQYIQLNPQKESEVKWKKIYIDLREIISNSEASAVFRISLQAVLDAGDSEGLIVLDNIKIVHF
jgi:hypothetical protein